MSMSSHRPTGNPFLISGNVLSASVSALLLGAARQ
jgi:hypothetical protein